MGWFLSVDPLAADFAAWSTYNYVLGNPLRFVDPTGMSADDIIIGKKDRQQLLQELQSLTNDKLGINSESGEVFIVSSQTRNRGKNLTDGSLLVRDLIQDNNTTYLEKNTRGNGTGPVDGNQNPIQTPQQGVEYDSRVGVDFLDPNTVNADGTRGGAPSNIVLAHELGHARDYAQGNFSYKTMDAYDYDQRKVTSFFQREYNTRVFENRIRGEQNVKNRALPIKIIDFN